MTYAPTLWERVLCRVVGHSYRIGGAALVCRRCLAVVPFPPPPPMTPEQERAWAGLYGVDTIAEARRVHAQIDRRLDAEARRARGR